MRRLLVVLGTLLAVPASAQSVWLDREHRPSIMVEQFFPTFDRTDAGFPTWTWFLSGKVPVGNGSCSVVLELPYVHGDILGAFQPAGSIGNPYVGLEYRPGRTGLLLEAGARLPLMSDEEFLPFLIGSLTDVDRAEAFVPDQVPVRIGLHYHHGPEDENTRISWDLRLVQTVWIPTDYPGGFVKEGESFLGYGATVRYEDRIGRVGAGFAGQWNASNEGETFARASVHQLDLAADFLEGRVRPGVQVKVPLDDSFLASSWGFTLTVLP